MIHFRMILIVTIGGLLAAAQSVSGQAVVPAAGGDASGAGGTASFSFGQLAYNTHHSLSGSAAEGVQQPYEIWLVTSLAGMLHAGFDISLFPNPADDIITAKLQAPPGTSQHVLLEIFDVYGKRMLSLTLMEGHTVFIVSDLMPGVYFVRANHNAQLIQTFKLIKR